MSPMSEALSREYDHVPALSSRGRTVVAVGLAVVVAAGIFLRFYTHSAEWLDEALTVNRAQLPFGKIAGSVKQDGSPPLYYYLLHFWMEIFGKGNLATRSLSGVIGVITLPVAWCAGNRLGGRTVAWTSLALLASAPFAVYYATEARMYGLIILLSGLGVLALHRALQQPKVGNLTAITVVTAALLYTQYWSLYLVAMVGIWLLVSAGWVRRQQSRTGSGNPAEWQHPFKALVAVAVGAVLFLPWVPTFLYQSAHTGTPWAAPANFAAVINAVTGFTDNQGSTLASGTNQGRLLAVIYFAMLALALFGIGKSDRIIELDLRTRPRSRGATFVVVGTLFAAIAGGILTGSAFSSRYAAVVFLPLILLIALGTTTLLNPKVRAVVVGLAVLAGLVSSAQNVTTQRTQAGHVAAAINAQAKAGDIVAFCPDQLGPAVYRQVQDTSRYDMITFPRRTGPAIVDWVDYAKTVGDASPLAFADDLVQKASGGHTIWLVWQPGYQTYGIKCEQIASDLSTLATQSGGGARNIVLNKPALYYEPMNLTQFVVAPPGTR
jgi:mannosyltransferase